MSKWLRVKEVSEIMNLGESFIRTVICKPIFKEFVVFEKPIMIKYNKTFETLILSYARGHNFKQVQKSKPKEVKEHKISPNSSRIWTASAIICYNLHGDCGKCTLQQLIHEKCRMKEVVPELIKKNGVPD